MHQRTQTGGRDHSERSFASAASAVAFVLMTGGGCAVFSGDASTPEPVTRQRPPASNYGQMALDPSSGRIFLEAGVAGDPFTQDLDAIGLEDVTWVYDPISKEWTLRARSPAGEGPLAFDAESGRLVKFIGIEPGFLPGGETWSYHHATDAWTQQSPELSPFGRLAARATYDAESDSVILFGGATADFELLDETWAYDLDRDIWQQMSGAPAPPPRYYHMMTYDSLRDRVLVWGGDIIPGFEQRPYLADLTSADYEPVWEYDRNADSWTAVYPNSDIPPLRVNSVMVFDPATGRVILHGGEPHLGGVALGDTWAYEPSASTWTLLSKDGPRITNHAMALVPDENAIFLFGGRPGDVRGQVTDEMWRFDLDTNEWSPVAP